MTEERGLTSVLKRYVQWRYTRNFAILALLGLLFAAYSHGDRSAREQSHNQANYGFVAGTENGSDDLVADYTFWLALFTAALVGVSGWQGYLILRAEKRNERLMNISAEQASATQRAAVAAEKSAGLAIAGQRPWLDLNCTPLGEMTLDASGVRFGIRTTLTNVGSSPAINALACCVAIAEPFNSSMLAQVVAQANAIGGNILNFGYVIFPGCQETMNLPVHIERSAFDAAVATGGGTTLALAIRLNYKFSGGEGVRSSAFIVWGRPPGGAPGYGNLDFTNGPIPPIAIQLQKMPVMDVAT